MEKNLQAFVKLLSEREELESKVNELLNTIGRDEEEAKVLEVSTALVQLAKEEGLNLEMAEVTAYIKQYAGPLTDEVLKEVAGGRRAAFL